MPPTDGPTKVEGERAEGDGLRELGARDQLGLDRLPRRQRQRRADAEAEREEQERNRRDEVGEGQRGQQRGRHQHPGLGGDQQTAAVDDVGQRARWEADEEDGQ
jgi:hypothetical protein